MGLFNSRHFPLLVFIFSLLFFSSGIKRTPMFFYDEERNSVCAREMAERNDFIVPTFNYELRTDKPPLHYYFMILSYKLFGVNEFASRFFSSLFGALTILITFLFTRSYFNERAAFYTILILLASINLALEFHLAVPDPYLIFFMTAAHFTFFDFYVKRNPFSLSWMYISIGLAILTKGPMALGFIGLNCLLFLLFKKDFKWGTLKDFRILWGILIILMIALPWFLEVGIATNWQWQKEFIFEQNLNRLTQEIEGHGGFAGMTIVYVFLAFFPFSLLFIQSFRYAFKKRKEHDLILFSLIISLVIILFFSLSATKLPNYPMPAYPFIALITGYFLESAKVIKLKGALIINLFISSVIPFIIYYGIRNFEEISSLANLSYISLVLPAGAIIALWFWLKTKARRAVLITFALTGIITSLMVYIWVFPSISRQDPVQQALSLINNEKPVAYYRRCNSGFPYYLKKPIQKLITVKEATEYCENTPGFYLISAAEYEDELKDLPLKKIFQKKDLFESPVTVLYEKE